MKEIKIASSQIKKAIDDLVNENEILQDKIYKQEDKIEELMSLYTSERYVKEDYKTIINKAIEYIESEKIYNDIEVARIIDRYEKTLLDILRGKDNE